MYLPYILKSPYLAYLTSSDLVHFQGKECDGVIVHFLWTVTVVTARQAGRAADVEDTGNLREFE